MKDLPIKELIVKLTNEINMLNDKFHEETKISKDSCIVQDFISKYNSTIDNLVSDGLFSNESVNKNNLKVKLNKGDLLILENENYGSNTEKNVSII